MPADRPDGSAALRAALTNPGDPDAARTAASTTSEQGNGGCNGRVTITATGAPVSRWSVTLPLRSSQQVVPVWNGSPSRNGNVMTDRSTWNGSPAAGASTSFGLTVDGSSASPPQIGARTASLPLPALPPPGPHPPTGAGRLTGAVTPVTSRLCASPRAHGRPGHPFYGRVEWPGRITPVRGEAGANPALTRNREPSRGR